MTVQLEYRSATFKLIGDGVATTATLVTSDFPFLNAPHLTPASVVIVDDGGGKIASAAVQDSVVVLTFGSAYSGEIGQITLELHYNIP